MIAGLILAGGQGARLGGVDKAMLLLAGAPLVAWTAGRLLSQVEALAISARGDPRRFAPLEVPVLPDPAESGVSNWGPLAGLLAGLAWAQALGATWLVTAPTDAPFLPLDLATRLTATAADVGLARSSGGREPVFAAWRTRCLAALKGFAAAGDFALHRAANTLGCEDIFFEDQPLAPFFNINTPEDLGQAQELVVRFGLLPPRFVAE